MRPGFLVNIFNKDVDCLAAGYYTFGILVK